ncbi:synaptogenesis protein syg-2-like [Centruroides sculpturatus]|uniref:synaptogenesis protein syg-2-like n=1 Tax=Centruroides sculpturatus TaxID=218467 RepID=UPI000C6DFFA3|nr:synaptogenesis protein syg-2-like [Centruroides sculpturatus]
MGFERNIPGYPRYFMIINIIQGVYNLRIEDVRLEDEAEFQCQVGPSKTHKPIRAAARLTVVIPPKNITINGLPDGEEVMIRESQKLVLTCNTRGSKPPVEMKWYRRTIELVPEATKVSVTIDEGRGFATSSSLTLYPKLEQSGTTYTCEALHPALEKPLRATISVGILFPPSPPIIQGYQDGDVVQIGDMIVLICISRGGKPAPRIIWYRNDVLVDMTHSSTGYETTNTFTFTAGIEDNNAVFRCEVSNALTKEPMKKAITFNVFFNPKNLTIIGPSEAHLGETITLRCHSDISNPPTQLSWVVNKNVVRSVETESFQTVDGWVTSSNLSITINRQDVTTKIISCYGSATPLRAPVVQTHTIIIKYPPESLTILGYEELSELKQGDIQRLTCVALGGNPPANLKWYKGGREINASVSVSGNGVSSELVFRVDASDNRITYTCRALSPAITQPLETSVILTVYFTAEKLLLSINPQNPKESQTVTISCQTGSCNPKPEVMWLRNNRTEVEYYEEIFNASHGGLSVKSMIVFVVKPSDDGIRFVCQAKSNVFPNAVEAQLILRVLYKPKFTNIVQKRDLIEGESTEINLTARGNPDVISYIWYKEGTPVPVKSSEDKSMKSNKENRLRVTSLGSVLHIRSASRHDSSIYTCEARNQEGSTNATVILNVRYPAVVTNISASTEAKEEDSIKLECSFDGNPLPENVISWRKNGIHQMQYLLEGKKSYLLINNISRNDSGEYSCIANNGMGKESIKTVTLSVLRPPETPVDLQAFNVSNNYIFITWKPGFDGGYVPSFRIRYKQLGVEKYFFQDATTMKHQHKIIDLKPGTDYFIAVSAWNDVGHSNFTSEIKVSTTDIAVMDSLVPVTGKKSKKLSGTSKWWWICVTIVGTLLVLVNVIVVICLIHKGKCCLRSIEVNQCIHDNDKQINYSIREKSFNALEDECSTHEHLTMERVKNEDRRIYVKLDLTKEKSNVESCHWINLSVEKENFEICEESVNRMKKNEFPDILEGNNLKKSVLNYNYSPEVSDFDHAKSINFLSSSSSITSTESTTKTPELNTAIPMTSALTCDLRIRHILFEPEQPTGSLTESTDS